MPTEPPSFSNEGPEPEGPGRTPAHPGFAAHFTSAIYDPDDPGNDETAPFGGNEGADIYAEWAEQSDELERLTLREMLDYEGSISKSSPYDLDEVTIAAGFVHLRATGWIDREGASRLRTALGRSNRKQPKREFATMLEDLASFSNQPPRARRPPAAQGWLRIDVGAGDRLLTRWCRETEKAVASDVAWSAWWNSTRFDSLHFYPGLFNTKAQVKLEEEGQVLVVLASTPQLGQAARRHVSGVVMSDSPPLPSLMTLPDVREMLDDLLLRALQTASSRKQLQTPPGHLPPLD